MSALSSVSHTTSSSSSMVLSLFPLRGKAFEQFIKEVSAGSASASEIEEVIEKLEKQIGDPASFSLNRLQITQLALELSSEGYANQKLRALEVLANFLELDPFSNVTAHGIISVVENLMQKLDGNTIYKEAVNIQEKITYCYACTIEAILVHYNKEHLSAIPEAAKEKMQKTEEALAKLNGKQNNIPLLYSIDRAREGIRRLTTDHSPYLEAVTRVSYLVNAVGDVLKRNPKEALENLFKSVQGLEKKFTASWYGYVFAANEIARRVILESNRANAELQLRTIQSIVARATTIGVKRITKDWQFIYSAVQIFAHIAEYSKHAEIREAAVHATDPAYPSIDSFLSFKVFRSKAKVATAADKEKDFLIQCCAVKALMAFAKKNNPEDVKPRKTIKIKLFSYCDYGEDKIAKKLLLSFVSTFEKFTDWIDETSSSSSFSPLTQRIHEEEKKSTSSSSSPTSSSPSSLSPSSTASSPSSSPLSLTSPFSSFLSPSLTASSSTQSTTPAPSGPFLFGRKPGELTLKFGTGNPFPIKIGATPLLNSPPSVTSSSSSSSSPHSTQLMHEQEEKKLRQDAYSILNLWGTDIDDEDFKRLTMAMRPSSVILRNCSWISDLSFQHLTHARNLTLLDLNCCIKVTGTGFSDLIGLPIRELILRKTQVGNAVLTNLVKMPLEHLDLEDTLVADKGLEIIGSITSLRSLNLWKDNGEEITNIGMRSLNQLNLLHTLNVGGSAVGDAGIKETLSMPQLHTLILRFTRVTDGCFAFISGRPFRSLDFSKTEISTLKGLAGMHSLTALNVSGTLIRNEEFAFLKGMRLEELGLRRIPAITDEVVPYLREISLCGKLDLSECAITDAAIPGLSSLTGLKEFDIRGTRLTEEGIHRLKMALRGCKIEDGRK